MREPVLPEAQLSEEPERSLRLRVFLKGEKWGKLSYHYVPTTLCRRNSSLQQRSERVLNCLIQPGWPRWHRKGGRRARRWQSRLSGQVSFQSFPFRRTHPRPSRPGRGRPFRNVAVTFQKTKTKYKSRVKADGESARGQSCSRVPLLLSTLQRAPCVCRAECAVSWWSPLPGE